jgi:hypothetical protein
MSSFLSSSVVLQSNVGRRQEARWLEARGVDVPRFFVAAPRPRRSLVILMPNVAFAAGRGDANNKGKKSQLPVAVTV